MLERLWLILIAFAAGYYLGTTQSDVEKAKANNWWFGAGYSTALRCDKADLDANASIDCYIKSFDREWKSWKDRGN